MTPFFLPNLDISGKAWAVPWSVTAMALWPHCAARFMTFSISVSASRVEYLVCRCSSTRFSFASSGLTSASPRIIE